MLEIRIDADAAVMPSFDKVEPDAAKFPDAQKGRSELALIVWLATGNAKVNWFNDVWSGVDWPEQDDEVVRLSTLPIAQLMRRYDLAGLGDKAAVKMAADDFKTLVRDQLHIG